MSLPRPANADPPFASVELRTTDGVELCARRWDGDGANDVAVVVGHGFTGTQEDGAIRGVVRSLRKVGATVVTFDTRGHGRSGGGCTLGADERLDVAAAVAHARERSARVVIVATSMGAVAALRYAADDDTLDGLVLVSCPATWRLHSLQSALAAVLTRTGIGRWVISRFQEVRIARDWPVGEPPVEVVGRVRVPVAVIHGRRDRFIPVAEAERLYAAARPPRNLRLLPDLGHGFAPGFHQPVLDALSWCLDQERAAAPDP